MERGLRGVVLRGVVLGSLVAMPATLAEPAVASVGGAKPGAAPVPPVLSVPAVRRRLDWPCPGCLFDPPSVAVTGRTPLVVVLHGDASPGRPPDVRGPMEALAAAARARGFALFAPRCPADRGCGRGSFWQWREGDPKGWLEDQLAAIEAAYPIDPDRVWLVGWSGGASYAGAWLARLGGRFAALAFVGGGMPPAAAGCPACLPPAYFLVGEDNPLHEIARALRDAHIACGGAPRWELLPRTGHTGERAAFHSPARAAALLDWLGQNPRRCGPR